MGRGFYFSIATIFFWSLLNVFNRFFALRYDLNVIAFIAYMTLGTGVALYLIRKPMNKEDWYKGVRYSWLYTVMQLLENYFMLFATLYITSTDLSLLFNIEIVITFVLAFFMFKQIPRWGDWLGSLLILSGTALFISLLNPTIKVTASWLVGLAALASCVRSIVVEKTTLQNPSLTVRQKCGTAGLTLIIAGVGLLVLLFMLTLFPNISNVKSEIFRILVGKLPTLTQLIDYRLIGIALFAGLFINSFGVYFFYGTLQYTTSVLFMSVRSFKPLVSYVMEWGATWIWVGMRPDFGVADLLLAFVILLGVVIILLTPMDKRLGKSFITQ